MAVDAAQPTTSSQRTRSTRPSRTPTRAHSSSSSLSTTSSVLPSSSSNPPASASTGGGASSSSRTSISSLRESLPEKPLIYSFSELCAATNNFLSKRHSSSSATPSWRCTLRKKDVIVIQRKFKRKLGSDQLRRTLAVVCRSHHAGINKLLGVSIAGEHIYLVYEYIDGANLADCLRNPRNPDFTVLSNWVSRMRIAADLASVLDYIHNCSGLSISFVHNHIHSNSIIITEPDFNAKLCHFGTALLCGEIQEENGENPEPQIAEERQFEGIRGYMSPEYLRSGVPTQKSDVYAFGVVLLELLSGEEPVKYAFDKAAGEFRRSWVVEAARGAAEGGQMGVRKWVDRKMKDSFPVEVAEKVVGIALECVAEEAEKRPEMGRVAGKLSRLYMESMKWSEKMRVPTEISISLAPR